MPVTDRPVSMASLASFFVGPSDFKTGTVELCTGLDGDGKCKADGLLKRADLSLQQDGKYLLTESSEGRIKARMQQTEELGVGGARRFLLTLPPDLDEMPGAGNVAKDVQLVLTSKDEAAAKPRATKLGKPRGDYQGANARAPGQAQVGGVNLLDGHLSFRHQDFAVPEYASAVRFSRTYNNQDNEIGTLGIGWRHSYEGYVHEESLGRYTMVLEGQSYDFPYCKTVNAEAKTASDCFTDQAHGGTLTVSVRQNGTPDVLFRAADGHRYKFDRASASRTTGYRRWLLTAFEDGHGRADTADATKPGMGWTEVEYYEKSDMIRQVARKGGKLKLTFDYHPCIGAESPLPRRFKALARREAFALLKSVKLSFVDPQPAGKEIGTVTFSYTDDNRGNLKSAEWVVVNKPPNQKWSYVYEPSDTTLAKRDLWAQSNELKEAALLLGGSVQERTRWSRGGTWEGLKYQDKRKYEIVNRVVLPGTSTVSTEGVVTEAALTIQYLSDTVRRVTRPDGVVVELALNGYGNVVLEKVGGKETKVGWYSDVRGSSNAQSCYTAEPATWASQLPNLRLPDTRRSRCRIRSPMAHPARA